MQGLKSRRVSRDPDFTSGHKKIYTKLFFIGIMFFGLVYSGGLVKAAGECECNVMIQSTNVPSSFLKLCSVGTGIKKYKYKFDFGFRFRPDTMVYYWNQLLDIGGASCSDWKNHLRVAIKETTETRVDYVLGKEWFDQQITLGNCDKIKINATFDAYDPLNPENKGKEFMYFNFSCALSRDPNIVVDECSQINIEEKCIDDNNKAACVTRLTNECKGKCADGSEQGNLGCSVATLFGGLNQLNITGNTPIQTFIGRAIKYVLGFVGSVALAMFVFAGFMWMTARGNSERIAKALKIMTWAALGTVVILSSYVILDEIFRFLT